MENKDQELIERYFCNELSAEKRAAFEQRRAADAAFCQAVKDFEKTIRIIRLDGKKTQQSKLAERGRQAFRRKRCKSMPPAKRHLNA